MLLRGPLQSGFAKENNKLLTYWQVLIEVYPFLKERPALSKPSHNAM